MFVFIDIDAPSMIYLNELKFTSFINFVKKPDILDSKVFPQLPNQKYPSENQYRHFRDSLWLLLLTGLCMGMNPITGFNGKKASDIRFTVLSIRFMTVFIITSAQAFFSCICVYKLLDNFSLSTLSYVAFYLSACLINLSLIRVATKWPQLVKEITYSGLYKYTDPGCKRRCNLFLITIMIFAAVEHTLSVLERLLPIVKCQPALGAYNIYSKITFNWLYSLGFPEFIFGSVLLQILTVVSTLIQSYSDVLVICASIYLSSIYNNINRNILKAVSQVQPPACWRTLREDYNQATRLVRCFDDAINTLVFISFASNLFFICFQLFNVLGFGVNRKFDTGGLTDFNCAGVPFNSLDTGWTLQAMYHVFSVLFLLGRFLVVTITTAKVNNEAITPTVALYNVSSASYCVETERFLEQINNDTVALSGLKFFYVTRGLLLSVIATIITYELVLLQYSDDFA